jgi:hypothetical protein
LTQENCDDNTTRNTLLIQQNNFAAVRNINKATTNALLHQQNLGTKQTHQQRNFVIISLLARLEKKL